MTPMGRRGSARCAGGTLSPPGWPVPQITPLSNKKLAGIISATAFLPPPPLHACASVPYQELSQGKENLTDGDALHMLSEAYQLPFNLWNVSQVKSTTRGRVCIRLAGRTLGWSSVHHDQYAPGPVCTRELTSSVNVQQRGHNVCRCRQDTRQILSEPN